MKSLADFVIDDAAWILIRRLLLSCTTNNPEDLVRYETLEELSKRFPIAFSLQKTCQHKHKLLVEPSDVIETFVGPVHEEVVKERLAYPQAIQMVPYFDLTTLINKAIFAILDSGTTCKVQFVKNRLARVKLFDVIVENVTIPKGLTVRVNEWVFCHWGVAISVIPPFKLNYFQSFQDHLYLLKESARLLSKKVINCKHLCPSKGNQFGFDITKSHLERL